MMGFGSRLKGNSSAAPLVLRAAALSLTMLLAGCGAGDVELNGKIFDAMGVSPSTQKKSGDPNVAARNGLIMPPSTGSLPEPGSGVAPETEADIAFINDPDRKRAIDNSEMERRQADYCKVHYEQAKLRGDQAADAAVGPAGPCRASVLTSMKKWNAEQDDEAASGDEK